MSEHLAASPIPVEINGKSYLASPLTFRDFGTVSQWMRTNLLRAAADAMAQTPMDAATRKAFVDSSMREANRTGFFSHVEMLNSNPEAIVMLVWLSLRKRQPDVTMDAMMETLKPSDTAELGRVAKIVMHLSGCGSLVPDGEAGTEGQAPSFQH